MSKEDLITFKHYRYPVEMQKTMNQRTCYEASISVGSMSLLRVKTGHILTKDDCMENLFGSSVQSRCQWDSRPHIEFRETIREARSGIPIFQHKDDRKGNVYKK